jgi:hypothetical protein
LTKTGGEVDKAVVKRGKDADERVGRYRFDSVDLVDLLSLAPRMTIMCLVLRSRACRRYREALEYLAAQHVSISAAQWLAEAWMLDARECRRVWGES